MSAPATTLVPAYTHVPRHPPARVHPRLAMTRLAVTVPRNGLRLVTTFHHAIIMRARVIMRAHVMSSRYHTTTNPAGGVRTRGGGLRRGTAAAARHRRGTRQDEVIHQILSTRRIRLLAE